MDSNKIGNHLSTGKRDTGKVDADSTLRDSLANSRLNAINTQNNSNAQDPVIGPEIINFGQNAVDAANKFAKDYDISAFKDLHTEFKLLLGNPSALKKLQENIDKVLNIMGERWNKLFDYSAQFSSWRGGDREGLKQLQALGEAVNGFKRDEKGELMKDGKGNYIFDDQAFAKYLDWLQNKGSPPPKQGP